MINTYPVVDLSRTERSLRWNSIRHAKTIEHGSNVRRLVNRDGRRIARDVETKKLAGRTEVLHRELRIELGKDLITCCFAWTSDEHVIDVDEDDDPQSFVVVDGGIAVADTITERYDVFAETHIPETWGLFEAVE